MNVTIHQSNITGNFILLVSKPEVGKNDIYGALNISEVDAKTLSEKLNIPIEKF